MGAGEWLVVILGSGTVGAVLKSVVDWWLGRGEKRQSREDAIADANDKLAGQLRKEIHAYWQADRDRLDAAEERIAVLVGQVNELSKVNDSLRAENMALQKQAGEDNYRLNRLAEVNADQALKMSSLENDLSVASDRIEVLEAALRAANIPVPEPRKRPGTGPLRAAPLGSPG